MDSADIMIRAGIGSPLSRPLRLIGRCPPTSAGHNTHHLRLGREALTACADSTGPRLPRRRERYLEHKLVENLEERHPVAKLKMPAAKAGKVKPHLL